MILKIPTETPPEYMHGFNLFLWISMIVLYLLVGTFIFFKQSNETDVPTQKWLFASYGTFALGMGMCRVFFVLAFNDIGGQYQLLLHIGFLMGSISFTPVIFVYEKFIVKNTKKVFTILALVLLGISIYGVIDPTQKTLDLISQRIGGPILGVIFAYLYFVMLFNTSGELRRNSWLMLIGMLFIAFGMIFDSFEIVINPLIPLWISPLAFLIGGSMIGITQRKKKSPSEAESESQLKDSKSPKTVTKIKPSSNPTPVTPPKLSSNPKPPSPPKSGSPNDGWD